MIGNQLRALIVEDSQTDTVLLLRELRHSGFQIEYQRVDNAVDMRIALETQAWDIILSDFSMPNFSAMAALELTQIYRLDIPFIIISGTVGEETAVAAMKAGAHDYFAKGRITRLGAAINREIREAEERKKLHWAEEQLRQSKIRFAQAFHANPSAICISTLAEDQLLDANPRFLELFAYQSTEIIGKSILDLGIWDNPVQRREQLVQLREYGPIRNAETRLWSKIRELRYVLISCEIIDIENEACVLSFIHDITERKQTENELLALYNATSLLFKADSVLSLGQEIVQAVVQEFKQFDCGLILIQPADETLLRLARLGEEHIETDATLYLDGKGLVPEAIRTRQVIYAPDVGLDPRYSSNNLHTKSELVIPLQTANGILGVLDLQSSKLRAFSERDQRIISAFAERAAAALETMILYEEINRHAFELEHRVTQRTRELYQAKEHIEAIFNHSSDAIAIVDVNGIIQQTNPAFNHLFIYLSNELFEQALTQVCDEGQARILIQALQIVLANKRPERLELLVYDKAKRSFMVDLALAPIMDAEDICKTIICSFRDITERKQLEENLRQTIIKEKELSQLKTRFTSMVSHDFRTPLATIQSSSDLLKIHDDHLTKEKRLDYLDKIQRQIKQLTKMLDSILLIGRAETVGLDFVPNPIDLKAFCLTLVEEIQTLSDKHQIIFTVNGHCSDCVMDAKLLRQIIPNLLSNAIKYSPNGGDIFFDLKCSEEEVIFSIQDQGIGIPITDQAHLFEAFHRAENVTFIPGTGLGLTIVKQAVDAHEGTIRVESEEGRGTRFRVSLPKQAQLK